MSQVTYNDVIENLTGFTQIYDKISTQISYKSDLAIVLFHFCLIAQGLRCTSVNSFEAITENEIEYATQFLPFEFNINGKYTIRYTYNKKLYILSGIRSNGLFVVNFMDFSKQKTLCHCFNMTMLIHSLNRNIKESVPSYTSMLSLFEEKLVKPLNIFLDPTYPGFEPFVLEEEMIPFVRMNRGSVNARQNIRSRYTSTGCNRFQPYM